MSKVALVTDEQHPDLSEGDRLLLDVLPRHGVRVEPVVWDGHAVSWEQYGAVVLRSCWDYDGKAGEFRRWVSRLKDENVPLWNPPDVVLWNMDKRYLRDLRERGASIVPTVWLENGKTANLKRILEEQGWEAAVVKPTISAAGFQTWRTSLEKATADQKAFEAMPAERGVMVQKFIPEIGTQGEWSLIFIKGEYSHSAIKRPAQGDFRVQPFYGGTWDKIEASAAVVEQARKVVALIEGPWLYARVDGIEVGGRLLVMELELIEPYLFLEYAPGVAERFAEAIVSVVK